MMAQFGPSPGMGFGPRPSMGMDGPGGGPRMRHMGPPHHRQQQQNMNNRGPRPNNMDQHPHNMNSSGTPGNRNNPGEGGPPPGQQNSGGGVPLLTLKLILSRDEASYLFGFDGVLINQLHQQTGANISLSDGDSPERVLSINGSIELIFKAFGLICRKLAGPNAQQLNLRLAIPASQCGSIIGKQGAKIKEIREITSSNIQVSQESLPDSTEKCVEISGSGESCLQSTYHICSIMQDTPIRGEVIPYVPKGQPESSFDSWKPVFLCGDKAYIIDGHVARPAPPELLKNELAKTPLGGMADNLVDGFSADNNRLNNGATHNTNPEHMNPLALMQAISNAHRHGSNAPQTSKEMTIPGDMVGHLIGKGGAKIDEIRRMSGAQVFVAEESGGFERVITLSGTDESILLAQFLVQSNIDMALKERNQSSSSNGFDPQNQQPPSHLPPPPMQMDGFGGGGGMDNNQEMGMNMGHQQGPGGPSGNFRGGGGGPMRGRGNFGNNPRGGGGFRGRGGRGMMRGGRGRGPRRK